MKLQVIRCTWCVSESRLFYTRSRCPQDPFYIYECSNWSNAYVEWANLRYGHLHMSSETICRKTLGLGDFFDCVRIKFIMNQS